MGSDQQQNSGRTKEILACKHRVPFYIECYENLGYTVAGVDKVGQNYAIVLQRETPQSEEERKLERSVDQKLRFIELADRKQVGFLTMFINLAIHVVLFCVQGAILYALHMDGAHPRVMLQIGVLLFWIFLAVGLVMKRTEIVGWKKATQELTSHLYDKPVMTEDDSAHPYVLSVLFTRNHGLVSDLIYWCTGRQFTHASLGLGEQTETFYSFTMRGFRAEHPSHRKIRGRHKESLCYQFKVTEAEYHQVAHQIETYREQVQTMRYDLLGAVLSALRIYRPFKPSEAFFCSAFVSEQLLRLPSFHLHMKSNMYLPTYLAKTLIRQDNLLDVKVNEV